MSRLLFTHLIASTLALDVGDFSIVPYGTAFGGLAGGFVARLGRRPAEEVSRITLDGAFCGGATAFLTWSLTVITHYLR